MPDATPTIFFQSEAGIVFQHPRGYAEIRYLPGKREATALTTLLTQLGRLLLLRGWSRFLADNREMAPFTPEEKEWLITHWFGHQLARPAPLLGVIVLPIDVFARLSFMEVYAQAAASSIRYVTYTDLIEAQVYVSQF